MSKNNKSIRTGQKAVMHCGQTLTITNYQNARSVTGVFEDGTKVHFHMRAFTLHAVRNPSLTVVTAGNKKKLDKAAEQYLRRPKMMNCGLYAEITEYINNRDVTILFEDGAVLLHKNLAKFRAGTILHPAFLPHHYKSEDFHGWILEKQVWRSDTKALYNVKDKNGRKDVASPQTILKCAGITPAFSYTAP